MCKKDSKEIKFFIFAVSCSNRARYITPCFSLASCTASPLCACSCVFSPLEFRIKGDHVQNSISVPTGNGSSKNILAWYLQTRVKNLDWYSWKMFSRELLLSSSLWMGNFALWTQPERYHPCLHKPKILKTIKRGGEKHVRHKVAFSTLSRKHVYILFLLA